MSDKRLVDQIERYYSGKFAEFGPTSRGVDWNSNESQELRFAQLLKVAEHVDSYTVLDYGCGYGALAQYLERERVPERYVGFDVSATMLAHARAVLGDRSWCEFHDDGESLEAQDFAVASGVFNVKLDTPSEDWERYVFRAVDRLAELGTRGFAFNMLTSYSDPERMRTDLYYGDPSFFFDRCKRRYARNVALLHDYGLYEFTLLVRKDVDS